MMFDVLERVAVFGATRPHATENCPHLRGGSKDVVVVGVVVVELSWLVFLSLATWEERFMFLVVVVVVVGSVEARESIRW